MWTNLLNVEVVSVLCISVHGRLESGEEPGVNTQGYDLHVTVIARTVLKAINNRHDFGVVCMTRDPHDPKGCGWCLRVWCRVRRFPLTQGNSSAVKPWVDAESPRAFRVVDDGIVDECFGRPLPALSGGGRSVEVWGKKWLSCRRQVKATRFLNLNAVGTGVEAGDPLGPVPSIRTDTLAPTLYCIIRALCTLG